MLKQFLHFFNSGTKKKKKSIICEETAQRLFLHPISTWILLSLFYFEGKQIIWEPQCFDVQKYLCERPKKQVSIRYSCKKH